MLQSVSCNAEIRAYMKYFFSPTNLAVSLSTFQLFPHVRHDGVIVSSLDSRSTGHEFESCQCFDFYYKCEDFSTPHILLLSTPLHNAPHLLTLGLLYSRLYEFPHVLCAFHVFVCRFFWRSLVHLYI